MRAGEAMTAVWVAALASVVLAASPARAERGKDWIVFLLDTSADSIPTGEHDPAWTTRWPTLGDALDVTERQKSDLSGALEVRSFQYGRGDDGDCRIEPIPQWPPTNLQCGATAVATDLSNSVCAILDATMAVGERRKRGSCRQVVLEKLVSELQGKLGSVRVVDLSADPYAESLVSGSNWGRWFREMPPTLPVDKILGPWKIGVLELEQPRKNLHPELEVKVKSISAEPVVTASLSLSGDVTPGRLTGTQVVEGASGRLLRDWERFECDPDKSCKIQGHYEGSEKAVCRGYRVHVGVALGQAAPAGDRERPARLDWSLPQVDCSDDDRERIQDARETGRCWAELQERQGVMLGLMLPFSLDPTTTAECETLGRIAGYRIAWLQGLVAAMVLLAVVALAVRHFVLGRKPRFADDILGELAIQDATIRVARLTVPSHWQRSLRAEARVDGRAIQCRLVRQSDQTFSIDLDKWHRAFEGAPPEACYVTVSANSRCMGRTWTDSREQATTVGNQRLQRQPYLTARTTKDGIVLESSEEPAWYEEFVASQVSIDGQSTTVEAQKDRTWLIRAKGTWPQDPKIHFPDSEASPVKNPRMTLEFLGCSVTLVRGWNGRWQHETSSGCSHQQSMGDLQFEVPAKIRRIPGDEVKISARVVKAGGVVSMVELRETGTHASRVVGETSSVALGIDVLDSESLRAHIVIQMNVEYIDPERLIVLDYGTSASTVVEVRDGELKELKLCLAPVLDRKQCFKTFVGKDGISEVYLPSDVTVSRSGPYTRALLPGSSTDGVGWVVVPRAASDRDLGGRPLLDLKMTLSTATREETDILSATLQGIKKYVDGSVSNGATRLVGCTVPNGLSPTTRAKFRGLLSSAWNVAVAEPIAEADAVAVYVATTRSIPAICRVLVYDMGAGTLDVSVVDVQSDNGQLQRVRCIARFGLPWGSRQVDEIFRTGGARNRDGRDEQLTERPLAEARKMKWTGGPATALTGDDITIALCTYMDKVARFARIVWESAQEAAPFDGPRVMVLSGRGIKLGGAMLRDSVERELDQHGWLQERLDDDALKSAVALGAAYAIRNRNATFVDESWRSTKIRVGGGSWTASDPESNVAVDTLGTVHISVAPRSDQTGEFAVSVPATGCEKLRFFVQNHTLGWWYQVGNQWSMLSW